MKKENSESRRMNSDFDEQALDALIQEALADDMFVNIPEGFADRLENKALKINAFRFWQEELLKHTTVLGGVLLMFAVVFGVFYYFSPETIRGIINFLDRFKWLLLGGAGFVFFMQLADSWIENKLGLKSTA